MSSVRMCDACGDVFSERAEDWSTAPVTSMTRDKDGNRVQKTEQMDSCPDCTALSRKPRRAEILSSQVQHAYEQEKDYKPEHEKSGADIWAEDPSGESPVRPWH
jgi:hypothetical protein